jgi:hypothetical protein
MATIETNDSAIGDEILAGALRAILEQPSGREYVIRVESLEATAEGTIASLSTDVVVIAETDDDARRTGTERSFDLSDITDLEIY